MKFDDIDIKIIRTLQRDARTNFSGIAKECGVSVDTIIMRFQRLKKRGVVKGSTIILDPRRLGQDCLASMEIDVEPLQIPMVVENISKAKGVAFCTPTMGIHNVFTVFMLQSIMELNKVQEWMKSLPHVRDVKTSIWVGDVLLCPENFELEGLLK